MNRGLAAAAVLAVLPVVAARAGDRLDLNGLVDVRAVATDASASYLDGGYGRTRFDDDHAGLRLGRLMLSGRFRLTDTVT
jgi:hypothetical protein